MNSHDTTGGNIPKTKGRGAAQAMGAAVRQGPRAQHLMLYGATGLWFAWTMSLFLMEQTRTGLGFSALACAAVLNAAVTYEKRCDRSLGYTSQTVLSMAACLGTVLTGSMDSNSQFVAYFLGCIGTGAGCAGAYLTIGPSLGKEAVAQNTRGIPCAVACGSLISLAALRLPMWISTATLSSLPLLSFVCVAVFSRLAEENTREINTTEEPRSLRAPGDYGRRPDDIPNASRTTANTPFDRWEITLKLAAFWLAFGFIWTLGPAGSPENTQPMLETTCTVLICLMAVGIYILFNVMGKNLAASFWGFATIMTVGIAAVAVMGREASLPFFALALAERFFVQVELLIHFAGLAHKNHYPSTLLFGRAFGVLCAAEAIGCFLGIACKPLMSQWLSFALLAILCVVIFNLMALITQVNAGINQMELERAVELARMEASIGIEGSNQHEALASALQMAYNLSAREAEICNLLLDSRSATYIADKLGISLSTVNTHIRHIYTKTGVSGRQELLDLANQGSSN